MITEVPSHVVDKHHDDELKNVTALTHKPKAVFQWPPDCLWPFIDHEEKGDT
jgi:hypothetical protein